MGGCGEHKAQAGAGPMGPNSRHHSHYCRPLSPGVVNEITFATRLTTRKVGVDSIPIPKFAVYHDPFFDPFPNPLCVLVLSRNNVE